MFGLPEWGVSEKLGIGSKLQNLGLYKVKTPPMTFPIGAGLQKDQPKSQAPYNYPGYTPVQQPTSKSSSKSSSYPSQNYMRGKTASQEALDKQRKKELKMIDSEFSSESKRLNKLEDTVRRRYGEATSQLENDFPTLLDQISKEKDTRMTDLGNTEIQRQQESQSALAQVRRLLDDIQRKNQAYLSATGNYGSSLPEAFGESFGRQAFSNLSSVQQMRDNAMREISTKKQDVENFFSKKISDAQQSYQDQLNSLKSQFLSQLDAIDQSRSASSSAKRQASIESWKNYTNAKIQLDSQLNSYADSLNAWRQQSNQSLQEAYGYDPGEVSAIDATGILGNLGSNFASPIASVEQKRQQGFTLPKKGTLQDEMMKQFPGLFGQYQDQTAYQEDPYQDPYANE